MFKKSILALTLVVSMLAPTAALADESAGGKRASLLLGYTIGLPFKALGVALSGATGLLVGATAGFVRGAVKGTKAIAGALGDEDGAAETLAGIAVGAAPGGTIYGTTGGLLWCAKGVKAGFEKPLKYATIRSAFGGIPDAVEWTAEGASKVYSK